LIVGKVERTDPTTAWLGVDVRLEPGWHTYWRSPGDAGAPPEFDWSDSRNLAQTMIEWPAPHRFSDDGIDTFGYAGHVLFPVKVRLQDGSASAHISLRLVLYVCSTICTQNEARIVADITPGSGGADAQNLISEWRSKVPREASPTMSIRRLWLERQRKPRLLIEVFARPALSEPDVFVDGDAAVAGDRPQMTQAADGASLISVPLDGVDHEHPNRPLHVTLVDGTRSLEAVFPQPSADAAGFDHPQSASHPANPGALTIWSIIAFSLLGGLILNFMPCVFPVLSLKLVSLVQQSTAEARSIRTGLFASAVGIVASFVTLAAVLSLLRSAGAQIGWGIQFQQPAFLIAMAAILAAFGANLLGLFEIDLPWFVARRLGGAGDGSSIPSHFLNGFVMTLLATPCSAPFVGTAVTFALSQDALQTFIVFAGLGLGMASPYLLLCAVPPLARLFPRPGHWMLTLRRISAFIMMATAVWLLTILAGIGGVISALLVGTTLGAGVLVLAARRWHVLRTIAGTLAIALVGIAFVAADRLLLSSAEADLQHISWRPLVPENIGAMVRAGHTVFVDIGASWCVTCKVNEAMVIDSAPVRQRLTSDIVPVKADWTRSDGAIAAYLRSFDRYGLPFNAVFGPGSPDGIVLPELLTQRGVLDAFEAASKHTSQH
jgi:suppressor for copper-sensitivity B